MLIVETRTACDLTGLTRRMVGIILSESTVNPAVHNGRGYGNQMGFSVPQACGLVYASVMVSRGWKTSYASEMFGHIANMTERQIAKRIESGDTMLIPTGEDEPCWISPVAMANSSCSRAAKTSASMYDLVAIHRRVMNAVKRAADKRVNEVSAH